MIEWALNVLEPDTGNYLSHRQLRRHPKLGPTWDVSYSNELGRLCQCLGKDSTGTGQRVKCTDTFRPVHFSDIPLDRIRGITVTSVVCKFRPEKGRPKPRSHHHHGQTLRIRG